MLNGLARLRQRHDAVLLDLDGTLLDGDGLLTPRTIQAVRALVDAGFEVLLCTGRGTRGAVRSHVELGLDTPVVAFNGAWIGVPGEAPVRAHLLGRDHVAALRQVEHASDFWFRHDARGSHTTGSDHAFHATAAHWYRPVFEGGAEEMPDAQLLRMSLFFDRAGPDRAAWPPHVWDDVPHGVRDGFRADFWDLDVFPEYRPSTIGIVDVHARCDGKAEAYDWLEQDRGIPRERTIAVGDQQNDIEMIAEAGLGVAMENSVPDVLARADLVIGHHAREGFATWIESGAPAA